MMPRRLERKLSPAHRLQRPTLQEFEIMLHFLRTAGQNSCYIRALRNPALIIRA